MGRRVAIRKQQQCVAAYAVSGSAKAAAEVAGIQQSTARKLIRDAKDGTRPELQELLLSTGRKLRAYVLDSTERALLFGVEEAVEIVRCRDEWIAKHNFQSDPIPGYLKFLADAYKSLQAARRIDLEEDGAVGPEGGMSVRLVLHKDVPHATVDPEGDPILSGQDLMGATGILPDGRSNENEDLATEHDTD